MDRHGPRWVAVGLIGLAVLLLPGCGKSNDQSGLSNVWTAPGETVRVPATFHPALESAAPIEKALASQGQKVQFDLAFTDPDSVNQLLFGAVINAAGADLESTAARFESLSERYAPDYRGRSGLRKTTIDGEPAVFYEYTGSSAKGPIRVRLIFASHGGHIYLTSLTSDIDDFQANARLYDQILRSWHWTR